LPLGGTAFLPLRLRNPGSKSGVSVTSQVASGRVYSGPLLFWQAQFRSKFQLGAIGWVISRYRRR